MERHDHRDRRGHRQRRNDHPAADRRAPPRDGGRTARGAFDAGGEAIERDRRFEPALLVVERADARLAFGAGRRVRLDGRPFRAQRLAGAAPPQLQLADVSFGVHVVPPSGGSCAPRQRRDGRQPLAHGRHRASRAQPPPRPASSRRRSSESPPAASRGRARPAACGRRRDPRTAAGPPCPSPRARVSRANRWCQGARSARSTLRQWCVAMRVSQVSGDASLRNSLQWVSALANTSCMASSALVASRRMYWQRPYTVPPYLV